MFSRGLALALACGALLGSTSGCQRRAPGPAECHDLAVRWLARETHGGSLGELTLREAVAVDDAEYQLTVECLTRPFDRQLVACVLGGRAPRACLAAFELRRGHPELPEATDVP